MAEKMLVDAATLNFAVNASYELNARIYETVYEDISLAGLVPINTNYAEWSPGYAQLIGDSAGQAEWQSTYAKDVPLADIDLRAVQAPFDEYAIGYQWNIGEVQKAQRFGINLSDRRAAAARRGADQFMYDKALVGDAQKGWTGLINNALVTPVASPATGTGAPNSAWVLNTGEGNKTPAQIVGELNGLLMGPASVAGTPGDLLSNRIALPAIAYRYIAVTPYGVDAPGDTILTYFLKTNLYTLRTGQAISVVELPSLATAATVGVAGGGRAIAWRNEERVLELPVPHMFRFYPLYQDGPFNFTVPGLARIGQLDVKLPGAVRYLDGITPIPAA